jgi:hypothetical protein
MSYDQRRGKSQIGHLTPEHKPLEIKGQMSSDRVVLCTIGKIFLRAIRYYPHNFKKDFI